MITILIEAQVQQWNCLGFSSILFHFGRDFKCTGRKLTVYPTNNFLQG